MSKLANLDLMIRQLRSVAADIVDVADCLQTYYSQGAYPFELDSTLAYKGVISTTTEKKMHE